MDLKQYDGRCVRLTTAGGEVYEGTVSHCGEEYVFHEYGVEQEALLMNPILFYRDDIAEVVSLEDISGPFGHYAAPYGRLEMQCLAWGTDMIEEVLESEEEEAILRMLACLQDHVQELSDRAIPGQAPWRRGEKEPEPEEDEESGPVYRADLEEMLQNLLRHGSRKAAEKAEKLLAALAADT